MPAMTMKMVSSHRETARAFRVMCLRIYRGLPDGVGGITMCESPRSGPGDRALQADTLTSGYGLDEQADLDRCRGRPVGGVAVLGARPLPAGAVALRPADPALPRRRGSP